MHYEINLSNEQMLELLVKMRIAYDLSYDFFTDHIEDLRFS